jgi:ribonuclease Z
MALASKFVAVSHGHMDHIGGLAYFCSQRQFQGMGAGSIICDARLAPAVDRMMAGYVDLEHQTTPYNLIPLEPEQQVEIKNNTFIRAIAVEHTVPALGYVVIERRSKLRDEFVGFPQDKLRELKERGTAITRVMEIPLVAYLGDTAPGPHLVREDVRKSTVVICECTFTEPDHKDRARIGMHMHADDIAEWLRVLECKALVLTHLSRRTNLSLARRHIEELAGPEGAQRLHVLMDHRHNRLRYERQLAEAGEPAESANPA